MADDVDDPFFDPDDLGAGLGLTAYELESSGLAVDVGGLPSDEPGDHPGLRLVDEDTLGRGLGLSQPDAAELAAAREAELARARSRVRNPADRRGPPEGVRGAHGDDAGDAEREVTEDPPRGGADNPRADAGGSDRIRAYLINPLDVKTQQSLRKAGAGKRTSTRGRKNLPAFDGAEFGFEMKDMRVLPTGSWRVVFETPPEDGDEVFKLRATAGLLLKASVVIVEGLIE